VTLLDLPDETCDMRLRGRAISNASSLYRREIAELKRWLLARASCPFVPVMEPAVMHCAPNAPSHIAMWANALKDSWGLSGSL